MENVKGVYKMIDLKELNYPKQYILNEENNTEIYKSIYEKNAISLVDEYMYNVVSVVNEQIINGQKYSLIQHDDKKVGWIKFNKSIQIFRFKAISGKFIDESFEVNEINEKMGLVKDFRAHFSNKLLKFKSEIEYKGEKLVGVFVKDNFFGFHSPNAFDFLTECEVPLNNEDIEDKSLYAFSNLKKPIEDEIEIDEPKIVSFLKRSNSLRIKVNKKDYYWSNLDELIEKVDNINTYSLFNKSKKQKYIDDIYYSIDQERNKSKELVKSVLTIKKYIKNKKEKEKDIKMSHLRSSFLNARKKSDEYSKIITNLKLENKEIKETNEKLIKENKEIISKLSSELKLNQRRLEGQKDYNRRLEEQKTRYKNRMIELEKRNVKR